MTSPFKWSAPRPDPRHAGDAVTRHFDQHIGKELRTLYQTVLAEPVPDRFLALLDQLEAATLKTQNQHLAVQADTEVDPSRMGVSGDAPASEEQRS